MPKTVISAVVTPAMGITPITSPYSVPNSIHPAYTNIILVF